LHFRRILFFKIHNKSEKREKKATRAGMTSNRATWEFLVCKLKVLLTKV